MRKLFERGRKRATSAPGRANESPQHSTSNSNNNNDFTTLNDDNNNNNNKKHVYAVTDWPVPRAGHCVAYDPQNEAVYLYGGYSAELEISGGYFEDLWAIPLQDEEFPSLLHLAAAVVRSNFDVDTLLVPEELRILLRARSALQGDQEWRLVLPKNTAPHKRTTLGMTVTDGRLWLYGGSEGSPQNADIFYFDAGMNQWITVEAKGSKPPAANYVTLISVGPYLCTFLNRSIFVYDTECNTWQMKSIDASDTYPSASPDSMVATFYNQKLYVMGSNKYELHVFSEVFAEPSSTHPKLTLSSGEARCKIITIKVPTAGDANWTSHCSVCFVGTKLIFLRVNAAFYLDLAQCEEDGHWEWKPLKLEVENSEDQTLPIGQSGTMTTGSATKLLSFGGHQPRGFPGYSNQTFISEVDYAQARICVTLIPYNP